MRVSIRWLADYIDLPTQDPEELAGVFASLGFEVEELSTIEADWSDVFVGRVDEIAPHPNADKVRLCKVNLGRDLYDVVCGAWNFETGAKVAFALPGAKLAGGMEIGRREIRGVASAGMICSERELGIGDDHTGILVLDPDSPVGVPLNELVALPDVVFDLAITPNRPDAMSMVGMARELSAYYQVPYALPMTEPHTVPGEAGVTVTIEDPSGCLRFVAREVRGTRIGPSPFWLRQRLRTAGIRPISNVVDVTNYVMMELGQPLHAFDLDKVEGGKIIVRRAQPGEQLTTLDGVTRSLVGDDLVVADVARPSGLAGTMGGEDSEVNPSTTRVLIEAAAWDPPTVMFMSRRHGLRSEASARFERGVDPNLPPIAAARAARLMVELTGAEALEGWVDEVAVPRAPEVISLPLSEVARVLGPELPLDQVAPLLTRLQLMVQGDDPLQVEIPTFRPDLTRPIDLVEEVARLWGIDRFSETVPIGPGGGWRIEQRRHRTLRQLLTGCGISQAVNLAFQGPHDLEAFAYPADHEARLTIRVKNPLNAELASLRTSLIPGLLRSIRNNLARGNASVALFETGRVFIGRPWDEDQRVPAQPERLGFAITGVFGPVGLDGEGRSADVFTATAIWRVIADGLGLGSFELTPASISGYHPGRTAQLLLKDRVIGHIGEIHPVTAGAYDIEGRVAAGEIDLAALVAPVAFWQLGEPSTYPPIEFDLAFEVDEATLASDLLAVTDSVDSYLLESARVFDVYRGGGLGAGRKSVAIRYVFRAPDHTLTGDEVAALRESLIEAARSVGATLRGA